jgi:hypothetical protein
MADKIAELAARMIAGVQTRNAGIVLSLKSVIERSSEKLAADVKSSFEKPEEPPAPKPSTPWFLSRKRWAWKYHDEDER